MIILRSVMRQIISQCCGKTTRRKLSSPIACQKHTKTEDAMLPRTKELAYGAFSLLALGTVASGGLALPDVAAAGEVRITHSITGGAQKTALDAIIADFEKANPGIKIKQIV